VDVSLEVNLQTNLTLKVARQNLFTAGLTNAPFGAQNPPCSVWGHADARLP